MPASQMPTSLSAWLPDGTPFVPAATNPAIGIATCPGPDARGECASLTAGGLPPCHAAMWVLEAEGGRRWPFRFQAPLQACPVTLLTGTPPVISHAS
jgi:hypothetical protein